jgi:hypothetical protein
MSYTTEIFTSRAIKDAANALDVLQAAQQHKLPADAKKHALLAVVMKEAADRFQKLASQQSSLSPDEFFRAAFERVRATRAEQALIAKSRREKRERDTAAREMFLADLAAA